MSIIVGAPGVLTPPADRRRPPNRPTAPGTEFFPSSLESSARGLSKTKKGGGKRAQRPGHKYPGDGADFRPPRQSAPARKRAVSACHGNPKAPRQMNRLLLPVPQGEKTYQAVQSRCARDPSGPRPFLLPVEPREGDRPTASPKTRKDQHPDAGSHLGTSRIGRWPTAGPGRLWRPWPLSTRPFYHREYIVRGHSSSNHIRRTSEHGQIAYSSSPATGNEPQLREHGSSNYIKGTGSPMVSHTEPLFVKNGYAAAA